MQGNLKQVQLPEVLQFISMGKSTGLLTVRDLEGFETTLMIRNGRIINSTALERQRRLGDLLVHRGILKRSILAQVLALQRTIESDKRLGQILVEREIIQESQIRDVLRLQLEEEIWNLFGLEDGDFRFDQVPDEKLGEATVQIDIEPLLLEGTRRQDEWRKIIRILPSDRLVLGVRRPKGEKGENIKLNEQEWRVLAQVNGHFPIRAVVNRAGMGRFEVYQILSGFVRKGLCFIKEQAPKVEVPEVPSGASSTSISKGMGGLLSRLTGGRRDDRGEKLTFISPIGMLAYFVNRMVENFFASRDCKATPEDARMLEGLWQDTLTSFCKADLIYVERNRLIADRCEQTLQLFEFAESTQDCYEDCVEGLLQLTDHIYRTFAQRLGERPASKIVRDLLDEIAPRTSQSYGNEFKLEERVQMVLRLAA